jgi:UDPglucose 6-dehydrogenase
MKLVFVGGGFVGLVSAAVFADLGNEVGVIEVDGKKVELLRQGRVPFFEPGLEKLIKKNKITFTTSYREVIPEAEVVFICVGTPTIDGRPDLTAILTSTREVARNLKGQTVVVIKSTVPPGANKKIEEVMRLETKAAFELASMPEFLREGDAIEDTLKPDRVVIGAKKKWVVDKLMRLNEVLPGERVVCDPVSAQMIKYAANAFLPMKISFANSIAVMCDKFGANAREVLRGMGLDKRIGTAFLRVGIGYGGSCFHKDVQALIGMAARQGFDFKILKAVEETNEGLISYFVNKAERMVGGSLKRKTAALLGLAFRPETSDMREARSIYLIKELVKRGAKIRATDPVAVEEARKVIKEQVNYQERVEETVRGADVLFLVTEWEDYRRLDWVKMKGLMRTPVVIDGRNFYNEKEIKKQGFEYAGIG